MVELMNTALMRTVMAAGQLRQRLSEERGQDLLEYAVLGGVMAAFIVGLGLLLTSTGALSAMACGIGDYINFSDTPVCP